MPDESIVRPDPIPHIPLIEPFSGYCLTGFLPSDAAQYPAIYNHPGVSPTAGYRGPGGSEMNEVGAKYYYDARVSDTRDWPFAGASSVNQRV